MEKSRLCETERAVREGGQARTLPHTDARSSRLRTWGARGHPRGLVPHNRDPGGLGAQGSGSHA